jgi:hypothetical protein
MAESLLGPNSGRQVLPHRSDLKDGSNGSTSFALTE